MIGNNRKPIKMKTYSCESEVSNRTYVSMYSPCAKNICRHTFMSYLQDNNKQKFTKSMTIHNSKIQTDKILWKYKIIIRWVEIHAR